MQQEDLCLSIATSWKNLSKYLRTPQSLRNLSGFAKGHAFNGFEVLEMVGKRYPRKKWSFARIDHLGWHFTSLGGYATYLEKMKTYCHLGMNNEFNRSLENIKLGILQLDLVEITDRLPKYVVENKEYLQSRGLIDQSETIFH